ncbi:hypothetical protein M8C21_030860 [Ambrosia artemisiifolia]|uniref:Uncharacterized protein n=1 Tax=Ambrosia artemisiifolia TaxID=4212 RepID=A0AAD5CJK2_AMBAR|nr:hypothetical protein M8C21_030860 [Ambrosia artemisiifolia]
MKICDNPVAISESIAVHSNGYCNVDEGSQVDCDFKSVNQAECEEAGGCCGRLRFTGWDGKNKGFKRWCGIGLIFQGVGRRTAGDGGDDGGDQSEGTEYTSEDEGTEDYRRGGYHAVRVGDTFKHSRDTHKSTRSVSNSTVFETNCELNQAKAPPSTSWVDFGGVVDGFNALRNRVEVCKLKVVYIPPTQSASAIGQGSEQVFSSNVSKIHMTNPQRLVDVLCNDTLNMIRERFGKVIYITKVQGDSEDLSFEYIGVLVMKGIGDWIPDFLFKDHGPHEEQNADDTAGDSPVNSDQPMEEEDPSKVNEEHNFRETDKLISEGYY